MKTKYAPVPLPHKDEQFTVNGKAFKINDVSTYQNQDGQYVAQCNIDTPGCDIVIVMTAANPFKSE